MAGTAPTMAFTGMGDDPGIDAVIKLAGMLRTGLGAVGKVVTNPWAALTLTGGTLAAPHVIPGDTFRDPYSPDAHLSPQEIEMRDNAKKALKESAARAAAERAKEQRFIQLNLGRVDLSR